MKAVLEREKRRESDARTLLADAEKKAQQYDINALAARQKELQDRINRCDNLKILMERLVADRAALRQKRERHEGDIKAMADREASLPAMRSVAEEAKKRSRNSDDLFKVLDVLCACRRSMRFLLWKRLLHGNGVWRHRKRKKTGRRWKTLQRR